MDQVPSDNFKSCTEQLPAMLNTPIYPVLFTGRSSGQLDVLVMLYLFHLSTTSFFVSVK
jgi:hypothetical protein